MSHPLYNATLKSLELAHSDLAFFRVVPDDGVLNFKPGQYTTLGLGRSHPRLEGCQEDPFPPEKAEKLIKRAYSISHPILKDGSDRLMESVAGEYIEFYIVLVRDNPPPQQPPLLTPRLFTLKEGDRLFCSPKVVGHYTLDKAKDTLDKLGDDATMVFCGTGTGEAPHNAMIWQLLSNGFKGRIVSINCTRYRQDLAYRSLHHKLIEMYPNFKYVELVTREPDITKKVYIQDFIENKAIIDFAPDALNPEKCHYFLCGNPAMIGIPKKQKDGSYVYPETRGVIEILEKVGFKADQRKIDGNIHYEEYW